MNDNNYLLKVTELGRGQAGMCPKACLTFNGHSTWLPTLLFGLPFLPLPLCAQPCDTTSHSLVKWSSACVCALFSPLSGMCSFISPLVTWMNSHSPFWTQFKRLLCEAFSPTQSLNVYLACDISLKFMSFHAPDKDTEVSRVTAELLGVTLTEHNLLHCI